jgi:PEGA domain
MKLFLALSLMIGISSIYGCATVTRGTTDVLVIESEPPGAEVEIQPANHHCKTPCSVKLKRRLEQVVSIRREDFDPVEVRVIPQVVGAGAAGMAGNVILGGLIGAAVDAGSGAMKDLKPNPIKVTMVASKPAQTVEPVVPASIAPAATPADTSVSTQAVAAGG